MQLRLYSLGAEKRYWHDRLSLACSRELPDKEAAGVDGLEAIVCNAGGNVNARSEELSSEQVRSARLPREPPIRGIWLRGACPFD